MELLPLPNFHWEIYLVILLLLFLFIVKILRKKRKKVIYKDIYEASIFLQKKAPNNREVQELLKKLEPYKYKKENSPIPQELKKKLLQLQKKLRK